MRIFQDRRDAGRRLADLLEAHTGSPDVVVLALPRGGVPIGYEVATRLHVPLDVLVVRKLGVPGHEEIAMGAIASGGARVIDRKLVNAYGVTARQLQAVIERETAELKRRERVFRGSRTTTNIRDKTVIAPSATKRSGRATIARPRPPDRRVPWLTSTKASPKRSSSWALVRCAARMRPRVGREVASLMTCAHSRRLRRRDRAAAQTEALTRHAVLPTIPIGAGSVADLARSIFRTRSRPPGTGA